MCNTVAVAISPFRLYRLRARDSNGQQAFARVVAGRTVSDCIVFQLLRCGNMVGHMIELRLSVHTYGRQK